LDANGRQNTTIKEQELASKYLRFVHKGADAALRGVESGKVSARDAMTVSIIAYDKVRLASNRPTSIRGILTI
jgi:hypothetical protein